MLAVCRMVYRHYGHWLLVGHVLRLHVLLLLRGCRVSHMTVILGHGIHCRMVLLLLGSDCSSCGILLVVLLSRMRHALLLLLLLVRHAVSSICRLWVSGWRLRLHIV